MVEKWGDDLEVFASRRVHARTEHPAFRLEKDNRAGGFSPASKKDF